MGQRIVVTGGAGFLGSHLCEYLLARDHHVTAIDDLSSGSYGNVARFLRHPRFSLVHHDVSQPYDLSAERIYNLASPASPVRYQSDPVKTTLTNVLGTLNGLTLAHKNGARFLQASTSEVYGDPEVHPQSESYHGNVNPIGMRACYDEGKRCAESLVMDFHRQRGVAVRLVRIFNTYGPRMAADDGRVVSNFIVQALRGQDITVYGDGSQTRSFCYATDLVRGLVMMMENADQIGPINLGNPHEFTVLALAREVIQQCDGKVGIVFRPLPPDDPKLRRPDITRARRILGYEPRVALHQGLQATIRYFRQTLFEDEAAIDAAPLAASR